MLLFNGIANPPDPSDSDDFRVGALQFPQRPQGPIRNFSKYVILSFWPTQQHYTLSPISTLGILQPFILGI
jgi:hypothetical protein